MRLPVFTLLLARHAAGFGYSTTGNRNCDACEADLAACVGDVTEAPTVTRPAADVVVADEAALRAFLATDAATIELDGTITLTAPIDVGRSVTLVSGVIDGAYATTCVTVHAAVELKMVGVTVRRCASLTGVYTSNGTYISDDGNLAMYYHDDDDDDEDYTYTPVGAGVACSSGADCAFTDCTFEKNMGPTTDWETGGGAVACFGEATCAFRGTTFEKNLAYYGGAVHCEHATCAFEDCVVSDNAGYESESGAVGCVGHASNGASSADDDPVCSFSRVKFSENFGSRQGSAVNCQGDGERSYDTLTDAWLDGTEHVCEFVDSTFADNTAGGRSDGDGTVFCKYCTCTFSGNTWLRNRAGRDSNCAGIFVELGKAVVDGDYFEKHEATASADGGGAIHTMRARLELSRSTFVGNVAIMGGAVAFENFYIGGGADPLSHTIDTCTFESNRAARAPSFTGGGALRIGGGNLVAVTDSVFKGNEVRHFTGQSGAGELGINMAQDGGGAVYVDHQASAYFEACTFEGNTVFGDAGGGAVVVTSGSSSESLYDDTTSVDTRAAKESEIPNFKGSYLGRFPLVLANSWTSDHLSERSRSVDAVFETRARGTLTLKRR